MALAEQTLRQLESLLDKRVTTSRGVCAEHGTDISHFEPMPPDAVVYPETTAEVQAIVKALADKGRALFEKNCAGCHRPNNGRVYKNIGTDLGRAFVVSDRTATRARMNFRNEKIGSPNRVLELPPDDRSVTPFKEFEGVSLEDKPELTMRDPKDCEGYNALPLGGIWAQAPYLHTGSVPTLFHLLMPKERPDVFIKSRLDYDTQHVGFEWRAGKGSNTEEGYEFDTTAFPAISNRGHDKDIQEDGTLYKLDWSDDREGAMAIVEYMKTL